MAEYFAALDKDRLQGELKARIDGYYNWILMTGRLARWRIAYNTYYGQRGTHNSSYVNAQGEKGELSFLMSNEYRNLVQHLLVMTTQNRIALETVSVNTDSRSKAQSYVAKGLIEYYRRNGRIDDNSYGAAEISLINDSAWVFNEWDVMAGDEVAADPDTQQLVRQGDIKSRARGPLDVVIDYTKLDPTSHDWRIVRDPVNKYDLAAQYPELGDQIVQISRDLTKDALFRFGDIVMYHTGDKSPDIDMWTFYHRRSPALPQGRMVQMVDKLIIFDGPIPYRKLPGNRICPAEQILSPLGYSNMNDLLGLQDVMDALISAGVTNMTTCGVNNIWSKPSPNFDFEQLAEGMNLIESDEMPQVLQLNKLSPEWFSLTNLVIQRMEAISGINAVARGNTQGKDFSGAAMALLQSMSIQFNSGFTRSVNKLIEENGNDIIFLTQDFAKEERLGMIIGEGNRHMMKQYSGASVDQIHRVYCRQSNPLKDTTAGVLTILQEANKVEGGLTRAQFAEILDTGNTDCLLEQDRNSKLALDQENEAMMSGDVPPVVFIENHPVHIASHAKIIASPDDKADPMLIMRVQKHVQDHLDVWGATNPNILLALKIPPLVAPPMMGGEPATNVPQAPNAGMSGASGPPGPGDQGGPPAQAPSAAVPPAGPPGGPPPVNQPSAPKNPLTGKKWDPQSGGLNQGVG